MDLELNWSAVKVINGQVLVHLVGYTYSLAKEQADKLNQGKVEWFVLPTKMVPIQVCETHMYQGHSYYKPTESKEYYWFSWAYRSGQTWTAVFRKDGPYYWFVARTSVTRTKFISLEFKTQFEPSIENAQKLVEAHNV